MALKTPPARGRKSGAGAATAGLGDETSVGVRAKKKAKPAADSTAGAGEAAGETVAEALGVMPGMLGGKPRQTLPANANLLGSLPLAFLPRRSYQGMDLTTIQPGAYSPQQLLELLADAWPELSQALWNFQRLAASDWSFEVRTPDKSKDDPEGKAELDQILSRVNANWGGFDALIGQWVMCVVLQGACAGETVPNETVDDVWDLVAVQPWTIFFQRDTDQQFVALQWQPMTAATGGAANGQSGSMTGGTKPGVFDPTARPPSPSEILMTGGLLHGGFRRLNEVTFAYVPLDADVDDPYGRAPFASVLQLVVWDMQIIKDLRQWSHVNAFGRIDVKVIAEAAKAMMPPAVAANKKEARLWFKKYLEDIQSAYNNLNPDDTYVHFDNVEVSATDSSGKTFDVDKLIRVLERRVFRALKQLPILMGSNEGTTETWGTLQMEVYALGIANIQRTVASLIEKLLNVALRLRGRNSVVNFTFETLRATDRQREAAAEWQEMKNAAFARDQGWITQDEASIAVTGSEAVADAPNPDSSIAPDMPDQGSDHPAPAADAPAAEPADVPDPNDPNAEQGDDAQKAGADGAKGKGAGKKKPADEEDDDEKAAEEESDRWQRRSHPIRGLDAAPSRRPAASRRARPADSAPAPRAAASLAPRLDRHEREALGDALASAFAALAVERSKDDPPARAHRKPSTARKQARDDAKAAVADYFRASKPGRSRLDHIIDTHRSAATAGNKRTWPPLADAVRVILGAAASPAPRDIPREGMAAERLADEEHEALLLSLAKMLEADYPDGDQDLYRAILDARTAAYNLGGNEGLDALGLGGKGTFTLSNSDLLGKLETTARAQAKAIQGTSRSRLAGRIADGLVAGDTSDQIAEDVFGTVDSWADGYRAANIAQYETDGGYFSGSTELWNRCGVPSKVWVTTGDPDPGAGASGETPCRDNAYGSPVGIFDAFPSGDFFPPAHNACECDVQPEGDPSDAAADSPWLGD
jgi:hypothetical protein